MNGKLFFTLIGAISSLFCFELPKISMQETPIKVVDYIKMGFSSLVTTKNNDYMSFMVGLGSRTVGLEHGLDICMDIGHHPGYSFMCDELSYIYSPQALKGAYLGIGARFGISVCEYVDLSHAVDDFVTNLRKPYYFMKRSFNAYESDIFYNFPVTLGYQWECSGRYKFLQAQITPTKYLTVSSGIGF